MLTKDAYCNVSASRFRTTERFNVQFDKHVLIVREIFIEKYPPATRYTTRKMNFSLIERIEEHSGKYRQCGGWSKLYNLEIVVLLLVVVKIKSIIIILIGFNIDYV